MYINVVTLIRLFLTVVSILLLVLAAQAWRRRRQIPEAWCYALLILCGAIYCFGYAGELAQTSLDRAEFWLHIEYLGIPWLPALWILSVRLYLGLKTNIDSLFIIPVVTFVAEMTNAAHGLYIQEYGFVQRGPFWVITMDHGPLYLLHLGYLYFSMVYGAWLILRNPRNRGRTRTHALVMVGASFAPHAGHLIYFLGWSPYGLDLAPLTLGLSGLMGYIGVFHMDLFELVPMARSLVFSNMRDGVIVLDTNRRLVDFNQAAQDIFPALRKDTVGRPIDEILDVRSEAARVLSGRQGTELLDLRSETPERYYEVRTSALYHGVERLGSACILTNITHHMDLLNELRYHAETDSLTGVANRYTFLRALERDCLRAQRYNEPLTLAVLDIDRLRDINDAHGHGAGDSVLLSLTDRVAQCIRASDMLCRYGGDEFAILLPQTNGADGLQLAERICRDVAEGVFDRLGEKRTPITVSLGVTTQEAGEMPDWEQLLKHADAALHEAKAQGRNRVVCWESLPQSVLDTDA